MEDSCVPNGHVVYGYDDDFETVINGRLNKNLYPQEILSSCDEDTKDERSLYYQLCVEDILLDQLDSSRENNWGSCNECGRQPALIDDVKPQNWNSNTNQKPHSLPHGHDKPRMPDKASDALKSSSSNGFSKWFPSEDRLLYSNKQGEKRDQTCSKLSTEGKIILRLRGNSSAKPPQSKAIQTPVCDEDQKCLQKNVSNDGIERNATQGDETEKAKDSRTSPSADVKGKADKKKKTKNQSHIVALLRYQIVESLVDEECRTCFNKDKRCCCCYICNLCCTCVCPKICQPVFSDINKKISNCELNVLRRLGVCSSCDGPLCSAAMHAFQSFNRSLDSEGLLREYLHQCWEDVNYLICMSSYGSEFTSGTAKSMLGCQLPRRYVSKLLREAVTDFVPPHSHCTGPKCHN